jgi:hypothetical protein
MSVLPTTPSLPLGRAKGVAATAAAVPTANPAMPSGRRITISQKTLANVGGGATTYAGTGPYAGTGA